MKPNIKSTETNERLCSCYDIDFHKPCNLPAKYKSHIAPTDRNYHLLSSYEYLCEYHFQYYHPHLMVSGFNISEGCKSCGDIDCNGDCDAALMSDFIGV